VLISAFTTILLGAQQEHHRPMDVIHLAYPRYLVDSGNYWSGRSGRSADLGYSAGESILLRVQS
jgi:hypothetical protein